MDAVSVGPSRIRFDVSSAPTGKSVEQSIDHGTRSPRDPSVVAAQLARCGFERAGQPEHRPGLCGEGVTRRTVHEEPTVTHALAELERFDERRRIRRIEDSEMCESLQALDSAGRQHTVFELQQLRGELDIGE